MNTNDPNYRGSRRYGALVGAILLAAALAAACGDDNPTGPSPIDGQSASSFTPQTPAAPPGTTAANQHRDTSRNAQRSTNTGSEPAATSGEVPGPVSNLTGEQVTGRNAVKLTWNPPTTGGTATSYTASRDWMAEVTVNASDCSSTVGATTDCSTTYEFLTYDMFNFGVRGANDAGYGEASYVRVTVTEPENTNVPGTVRNLAATQATDNEDVTVRWDPPTESTTTSAAVDTYTVDAGNNWLATVQSSSCSRSCSTTLENMSVGSQRIGVSGTNMQGTGESAEVRIEVVDRTAQGPPEAVQNLTASQVGRTNTVTVTWSPPAEPVTHYRVERGGGTGFEVQPSGCSTTGGGTSCTTTVDSLTYDEHWFAVYAVNSGGTSESRWATVNVVPPFSASISDAPSRHRGNSFTFGLTLSAETNLSYRTLRDTAFDVTNGHIRKAQRRVRGSNRRWTITLYPTGGGTVTIHLPNDRQCSATGAICNNEGHQLAEAVSATVAQ